MNKQQIEKALADLARTQLQILDELRAIQSIFTLAFTTHLDQSDPFRLVIRQTIERLLTHGDVQIEPRLEQLLRELLAIAQGNRTSPLPGISRRAPPESDDTDTSERPDWLRGVIDGGRGDAWSDLEPE